MKKRNIYAISSIILLLTILIREIIIKNIYIGQNIEVIKDFFTITNVKNSGGAFSILNGNPIFIVLFTVFILLGIMFFIKKNDNFNKLEGLFISFLLGGTLGNFFERILYINVTDYLSFNIFGYHFPVFNLADIFIVISLILYMISLIRESKYEN